MHYALQAWSQSVGGTKHEGNEDVLLAEPAAGVFALCDGMGGKGLGTKAAPLAVAKLRQHLVGRPELVSWPMDGTGLPQARPGLLDHLRCALLDANTAVHEQNQAEWNQRGMGTTATVLLLLGRAGFVGHVGHCRLYLLRGSVLHCLTEDHTVLAEIRKRKHGFDEATLKKLPYRNSLTRTLGPQPTVDPDVLEFEVLPGDRLLLCSNGLHAYFDDEPAKLAQLVLDGPLAEAPARLVAHVRSLGTADDASALLIAAQPTSAAAEAEVAALRERFSHWMQAIRTVRLFQYLDDAELLRLIAIAEDCEFPAGQPIVQEGEAGDALFVLLSGEVSVHVNGQQVAKLGPGSHFGEMALITSQPRSATVRAEQPVMARRLRQGPLFEVMREHPGLANKILWNMVQSLSERLSERSRQITSGG